MALKPGTRVQMTTGGGRYPKQVETGTVLRWTKRHGNRADLPSGYEVVQFDGCAPIMAHADGLRVVGRAA